MDEQLHTGYLFHHWKVLVISQVEMISYIAQQIPPIFPPIPLSAILPFDHVPHFHWIK